MVRRLLVSCVFVLVVQAAAPASASADCGGPGQVPCYRWDWCAWRGLFNECWGGLVPSTPCGGCNCDRLNNWGLVCVPCGSPFEPTCQYGSTCDTDQRYTAFGLCYPCGQTGQAACVSGPACDVGNRAVFGFCAYSGFSAEPTTNVVTMPALAQTGTGSDPVRGIADLHTHQFANLGFGGVVFWGAPHDARGINSALPWCDYTWEFSIKNSFLGIDAPIVPFLGYEAHGPEALQPLTHIVSNGIPEGSHPVAGTGPFDGWPTYKTYTHQQMYFKWVERAFLGGVRLIVMHAVSNEALCKGSKRRSDFTCNDMQAVDRQIQAAKDLERAIDRMDDGLVNATGWYRIAYSPAQARSIIRSGKMAVVLGIEVDTLFNCKPGSPCTRESVRSELARYYAMGVRQVFPIHQFDNAFGGAAIFRDELNAGNAIVTGSHFAVRDCSAQGYTYNVNPSTAVDIFGLLALGVALPDQTYYDGFAADCNARGLTPLGQALIEEMMDQKFIIDIDHMSRPMMDAVLTMAQTTSEARPNKYPLVSSHTSFMSLQDTKTEFSLTDAQLAIMKDIGGMITATNPKGDCETTRNFREGYDYAVAAMRTSPTDAFPRVAFSTDANGFGGSTAPRFGSAACGADTNALAYPFTGIMGGTFAMQQTGDRSFNFNTQGLAHYGQLADFFADLKRTGMTDASLDPLLNSAESYIRLWEEVDNSDRLPPPEITAQVVGTQGTNGWYTSDVTVTWEVTGALDIVPTTVGCGPTSITSDTTGMTLTCRASNPGTGETSLSSVTIRRDATPPTFTATRMTATPASGWTNADVVVRFTASDAMSGLGSSASVDVRLTREGQNLVASQDFYDQAGNRTRAELGGINIDKTRPNVGFRFSHLAPTATAAENAAEQAKWHNRPITLIVDAQDTLSGIASVTPAQLVFSTEGAALVGSATATDRAGNSVSDTSDPIKIDLTDPTIRMLSRLPAANAFGWNNAAVTVQWECADVLSGVEEALVARTVSGEGDDQSATQTCVDHAGNTASHSQRNIRIDLTAPTLAFAPQAPAANEYGWNNTDVAFGFTPADALAGVASTSIPSPLVLSAEGTAVTGGVSVTDRAGNSASFTSPAARIDKTAPAITFLSRLPASNPAGWNNTDITIRWSCADALSGVRAPEVAQTLSTEGANLSLTGTCLDQAGNATADTRGGLNLDKTPPVVECAASPDMLWPPNNQLIPIAIALTFTDALSGTASFLITDVTSNEPAGRDTDIVGFAPGLSLLAGQLRAQRDGAGSGRLYTLGYEGWDVAGNSNTCGTTVTAPHNLTTAQ